MDTQTSWARTAKNWTKLELANKLKVNVKNISRWELNQSKPSFDAACDLARALDVSLDYLGGFGSTDSLNPLETLFKQKMDSLSDEKKKALEGLLLVL